MYKVAKIESVNGNPARMYDNGIRYENEWDAMEFLGNVEDHAVKSNQQIDSDYSNVLTVTYYNDFDGRVVTVYAIMEA